MVVVILYNAVESGSSADELDVLNQLDAVSKALSSLGYEVEALPLTLNLSAAAAELTKKRPAFVFNLVETVDSAGRLIYFAPALLEHLKIPFSGADSEAMFLTTNKLLTKERLKAAELPTPEWFVHMHPPPPSYIHGDITYIIKPVWEDASVGIDGHAALAAADKIAAVLKEHYDSSASCFAEKYIHGREFNLSVLSSQSGPEVLPAAEIEFIDFPADRPKIVDYKAKWETESFEYKHTVRRLDFPEKDKLLIDQMRVMALKCWQVFNLRGYARVDFRVDSEGRPWILEINANPCISPDSGFVAACEKAGLTFKEVIERIIWDLPH
jgi:D-alanine-D-alanine ligase